MRSQLLIVLIASFVLLLTSCQSPWLPGGSTHYSEKAGFSLHVPAGWTYRSTAGKSELLATKEGVFLQQLLVGQQPLDQPLPHSQSTLSAEMTVFELAEAVLDDLRSDKSFLNVEVSENVPAKLGGYDAFKLVVQLRNSEGLRLTETRYGCIVSGKLYLVRFVAPSRYYYNRDLATFETAVESFQFRKS